MKSHTGFYFIQIMAEVYSGRVKDGFGLSRLFVKLEKQLQVMIRNANFSICYVTRSDQFKHSRYIQFLKFVAYVLLDIHRNYVITWRVDGSGPYHKEGNNAER